MLCEDATQPVSYAEIGVLPLRVGQTFRRITFIHGTALVYPGDELPEPLRSFIETAHEYENSQRFSQSTTSGYTGVRPFDSARRSVYSKAVKVMLVNLEGTVRVPHRTDSVSFHE